jgi:hypothetical protein
MKTVAETWESVSKDFDQHKEEIDEDISQDTAHVNHRFEEFFDISFFWLPDLFYEQTNFENRIEIFRVLTL